MDELFVCEKPSVARDLATAISGGYQSKDGYYVGNDGKVYTNAFGHLVSCVMPEEINKEWGWKGNVSSLPFFMKDIPLKVLEDPGINKQFKTIVKLMEQAKIIYIATDAGREGEHIFRKIYSLSGVNKPLKRIWLQDFTKEGINKAYVNSKDGNLYEGLALAGKLREESDLMIGLNFTMLLTKLSGSQKPLSLGRVQTPTLSMIVNRDKLIKAFKKTVHYSIAAKEKNGNTFELLLDKDTHLSKEDAEDILSQLGNRQNYEVKVKDKKEKPQQLFNLTKLQSFMNEKYKWSAAKTLKVTQNLYEKQYVTYPRTDSQYLANDSELPELLEKHAANPRVANVIEKGYKIEPSYIDPTKVTDHEAIIITTKYADNLTGDDKILYDAISTRFIAAFYPPAVKEETTATFTDSIHTFRAKETVVTELGWRDLVGDSLEEPTLKHADLEEIMEYSIIEKETKPKRHYTESALLLDMENSGKFLEDAEDKKLMKSVAGIGTVATRAEIIEKLIKVGYIERKGNNLVSTDMGVQIIDMMPENFPLYSVKLTAFFESMLSDIEKGELTEDVFYDELQGLIDRTNKVLRTNIKKVTAPQKEVIASCPNCGKDMYENTKAYYCSGYKGGCMTSLWKNGLAKLGKKNITKNEAKKLLSGKKVNVKLKSKSGNDYKKDVVFNKTKGWVVFAESNRG